MIIGIDVSKSKLDVMLMPQKKHFVVSNDQNGLKQLNRTLATLDTVSLIVFESTGGYEKRLALSLSSQGYPIHIADGKKVFHLARQKGYQGKSDKLDAQIIGEYGMQHEIVANSEDYLDNMELRELEHRLRQLKNTIASEKKRLDKGILNKDVIRSIKRNIKSLEQESKLLESKLLAAVKERPEKQASYERYQSVKGIGPSVALTLVCNLPELGKRTRSTIAALAGLAPVMKDSGIKQGKRMIKGGRGSVRGALYMAALSACRFNQDVRVYYQGLLARGKAPKMALTAVMRKLLLIVNAMEHKKVHWQASYSK